MESSPLPGEESLTVLEGLAKLYIKKKKKGELLKGIMWETGEGRRTSETTAQSHNRKNFIKEISFRTRQEEERHKKSNAIPLLVLT